MKKLLSAVTSVAMSLSLMAGAFASPVSAAGGDTASQPKLNMGGVLDVSANKNAGESVEWNMGSVTVAPGQTATLPVVVSKSTLEVAGAQFKINPASPIKLKSVTAGEAYGANASFDGNVILLERSNGKGVVAANDSVVINLTFSVPNDCPEGTYEVKSSDLVVTDAKSADITSSVKFGAGSIKVQKENVNGNVSWVLDNVTGAPGETVNVKAYVSDADNGALAVAGAQFKIKTESPIEFKSLKEGGAYASPISFEEDVQTFLFDEQSGKGVVAADNATIMNISYTIPSNCPEGTYKVAWSDGVVSNSKSADITSKVKFVDGSITVGSKTSDNKIKWTLSNETAKKGDVVTLTAKVDNKSNIELPVGGAQFKLEAKSPITYNKKIAEGNAYGAAIKSTDADRFLFELDGKGKAAADGTTIFTADFKVPDNCPDGLYTVSWAETFVSDSKSNDVTKDIILVDGSITVGEPAQIKGEATWVIPSEVQAEAGKSVELVAKVKGDSELAVAGAQFSIVGTDPTKLNSVTGKPYGMTLTTDPEYKANCIFENVSGKTAKDDDVLFTIKFDVPAGTPDGIYPVKWSKQFVTNEKSVDITDKVTFIDGSIRVGNPVTTTSYAGQGSTTTTTTKPISDDALIWQIDTKHIESPKEDTKVDLRIYVNDKNNAKVGVAGAQFRITNKAGISFDSAKGTDAYQGTLKTQAEKSKTLNAFYFESKDSKNVVAANDSDVVVLTFIVPANTPAGTYSVDFADGTLNVTDEKSKDITSKIVGLGGAIIIDEFNPVISSTTTTTTGTTTTVSSSSTTSTTAPITSSTESSSSTTSTTAPITSSTVSSSSTTSTVSGPITETSTSSTVSNSSTTTTATTTGTTTTVPEGAILWVLDTVHAKPGETVKVNMIVKDPNAVNLAVAAAQFSVNPSIKGETGATLAGVGEKSGYGSNVVPGKDNDFRFLFEDKTAHIAKDGTVVVELSYKVGEKAVPGTDIALKVSDLFASNGKSVDITKNIIAIDGLIIVDKPDEPDVSTITTVTGTTTTVSDTGSKTTTTVTGTTTVSDTGSKTTTTVSDTGTTTSVSNPGTTTTTVSDTGSKTTTTVSDTGTTTSVSNPGTTTTTVSDTGTSSTTSSTTTVTGPVSPITFTTTSNPYGTLPPIDVETTTTANGFKYFYGTIKTQVGFYFSHDNGIRANGDKGGFSPEQVVELNIYDVFEDGSVKLREAVDMSKVNFGLATPEKVYNTRTHTEGKTTIDDFKYDVPVMYDNTPLVNTKGEALTVPVYIGVKGDINLDNKVNAVDASTALSYYASYQTNGNSKTSVICQNDKNGLTVTSPTDDLDQLAAFLGDVDTNEYDPANWKTTKADRTVNAVDASYILSFYAEKQTTKDKTANDIWNDVLGSARFGTK